MSIPFLIHISICLQDVSTIVSIASTNPSLVTVIFVPNPTTTAVSTPTMQLPLPPLSVSLCLCPLIVSFPSPFPRLVTQYGSDTVSHSLVPRTAQSLWSSDETVFHASSLPDLSRMTTTLPQTHSHPHIYSCPSLPTTAFVHPAVSILPPSLVVTHHNSRKERVGMILSSYRGAIRGPPHAIQSSTWALGRLMWILLTHLFTLSLLPRRPVTGRLIRMTPLPCQ